MWKTLLTRFLRFMYFSCSRPDKSIKAGFYITPLSPPQQSSALCIKKASDLPSLVFLFPFHVKTLAGIHGDATEHARKTHVGVEVHFAVVLYASAVARCACARIEQYFVFAARNVPRRSMPEKHAFAALGKQVGFFERAVVHERIARSLADGKQPAVLHFQSRMHAYEAFRLGVIRERFQLIYDSPIKQASVRKIIP